MSDHELVQQFIEQELEQRQTSLLPACGESPYITAAESALAAAKRLQEREEQRRRDKRRRKMCQAYEAEAAAIRASERYETRLGFKSRLSGQPKGANPNHFKYDREAWEHGWECADNGRTVPYCIERDVQGYLGRKSWEHVSHQEACDFMTGKMQQERKEREYFDGLAMSWFPTVAG